MTDQPLVSRAGDQLSAADVHGIWKIRDIVFAVEQECDEPDVDDRDLLASTTHLWLEGENGAASYVRLLTDPDGARRIGRVCTRRESRGQGLSSVLIGEVISRWGDEPMRMNAQAHLEGWYAGFGFARSGENFMEAGIDHLPMERLPRSVGEV